MIGKSAPDRVWGRASRSRLEQPVIRSSRPAAPRFAALHVPDYRRYFLFAMLAMTADNIEHVISYWVIFQKFHSPTLGGFAVISHWMPFLLFSVYMGALADRYDCRRLIQAGQGLFMLASILWGVLFLTDTLRVWHAVVILLIHGAAGVVGTSAVQLILHDMVGTEQLHSAIRLNASSRNLAILFGPAVGGGLMLLLGPAWAILANVLIYFPLTIFLIRVPYTGHGRRTEQPRRARFGLAEAVHIFGEARADRRITTMIVLGGATSFLVGNAFQECGRRRARRPAPREHEPPASERAGRHRVRRPLGRDDGALLRRDELPGRHLDPRGGRRAEHHVHVDGPDDRPGAGAAPGARQHRRPVQHGDPRAAGRQRRDGGRARRPHRHPRIARAERGGRGGDGGNSPRHPSGAPVR